MLHKISTAFVLLAYATSAVAEAPKGPISLKPTSAWHVDYADDRCRLARQFGADDELVYAFFERQAKGFFRTVTVEKGVDEFVVRP